MEELIYVDSEYISPLALAISEMVILLFCYLMARLKEKLPGGNKTIYP